MLYSIGKDSSRDGAAGAEGVPSRAHPVSPAARRHHLQVPGNDRVPRPRSAREIGAKLIVHTNQQAIDGRRQSVPPRHRRSAAACSRPGRCWTRSPRAASTRPSAAPAATRRSPAPRNGSTPSATPSASGTRRTSGPSSGTSTTAASTRARASASSRSPTGPSWTSGSTSTWRTSPSCRCTSPRSARWWCAASTLIPVEHDMPLLPGEKPQMVMCRMRSLGCTPCTGAIRSEADTVPKIIEEMIAVPPLRAREPRHRPRPGRLHGDQEARGIFLMPRQPSITESSLARTTAQNGTAALHHRRQRGRRQVHADRPPAVRFQGRLRRPDGLRPQGHPSIAPPARSTSRCSPTACAPSASRASPSTSPTATSPRRGASSSSPTRRATSSTRATWPPAPPPRTWPSS